MNPSAEKPVAKPKGPKGKRVSRRHFVVNLVLCIGLAVQVTLWFQRHIQFHTVESIFIGGALSLWALFQLVRSCVEWAAEDEMKALSQRMLASRTTTEYLVLGLVFGGFLHVFTSSIYITYEPTATRTAKYRVEVLYQTNQLPYLAPLEVTSEERVAGRPYFFRWHPVPLRIHLTEPRGYRPIDLKFTGWKRVHLRVPVDFERKSFHLLRLVPSPKLMNQLPEAGQQELTQFTLEVTQNGQTNLLRDIRKQVLYLGAAGEDMRIIVGEEKPATRAGAWDNYLAGLAVPSAGRAAFLEFWEKNAVYRDTAEFRPGDEVGLVLRRHEDPEPLFSVRLKIEETDAIQTIYMAKPR